MSKKKDETKTGGAGRFTIDSTKSNITEIPSVTKLLNRKTLTNILSPRLRAQEEARIRAAQTTPPPAPPSQPEKSNSGVAISVDAGSLSLTAVKVGTGEPTATETSTQASNATSSENSNSIELSRTTPLIELTAQSQSVKVQPAARRADRTPAQKLILWELDQLKTSTDPLGKGISVLFENGALSVLFLSIAPAKPGGSVPEFVSAAAVKPEQKTALWTGLKWDPAIVPEMWNIFVKNGYVELSPPGTITNQKSNRNVVRAAFGVHQNEWLLLVRVGPLNSCRGVVGVISKTSMHDILAAAMIHIGASASISQLKAS